MTRRIYLSALLAIFLAAPMVGASPRGFVEGKQGELTKLLKKKGAVSEKKVERVFDGMLDYDSLAKESLGKYWAERSEAERKEFKKVLKNLVRNAYRKNLKKTLNYKISYTGQSQAKSGVLVQTVAKSRTNKREEAVSIDYALHKVDGKWRIYDIVTEGSSLVRNYRSQFSRVIRKKGFDELMRRMKRKLGKTKA